MDELFIALYLDEDIAVEIGAVLGERGWNVLTTRDASNLNQDDETQLAFAVQEKRTIVTHNRDHFHDLAVTYYEKGKMHYGIIIAVQRRMIEIARRIEKILDKVTADEMINQIRYI